MTVAATSIESMAVRLQQLARAGTVDLQQITALEGVSGPQFEAARLLAMERSASAKANDATPAGVVKWSAGHGGGRIVDATQIAAMLGTAEARPALSNGMTTAQLDAKIDAYSATPVGAEKKLDLAALVMLIGDTTDRAVDMPGVKEAAVAWFRATFGGLANVTPGDAFVIAQALEAKVLSMPYAAREAAKSLVANLAAYANADVVAQRIAERPLRTVGAHNTPSSEWQKWQLGVFRASANPEDTRDGSPTGERLLTHDQARAAKAVLAALPNPTIETRELEQIMDAVTALRDFKTTDTTPALDKAVRFFNSFDITALSADAYTTMRETGYYLICAGGKGTDTDALSLALSFLDCAALVHKREGGAYGAASAEGWALRVSQLEQRTKVPQAQLAQLVPQLFDFRATIAQNQP